MGQKAWLVFRYEVSDLFSEVILPCHKNKGFPVHESLQAAGQPISNGSSCWLLDHHNGRKTRAWSESENTEGKDDEW